MYQVAIRAIIGVLIPYGIFYLYYKRLHSNSSSHSYEREEYDDKPERAHDDRREADEHAPELRLEDPDEFDFKE